MDKMTELLQQLANKLGTTVEYLWSVLVAQARIEFYKSIVFLSLSVIISFITYKIYKKGDNDKSDDVRIGWIIIAALCCLSIIISIVFLVDSVDGVLNPQYWALREILSKLNK